MMTSRELNRHRRQMQLRIRDVLAQRRADAPAVANPATATPPRQRSEPPERSGEPAPEDGRAG
jgi:hypothetical protein